MPNTDNYGWEQPDVGGDNGSWGSIINATLDEIDADLKAASDVASAALPAAGGTLSGRVDSKTGTLARVDKGSISGAQSLDLSTGQYFTMTLSGNTTLSFANVPSGAFMTPLFLRVTNGGTRITWPASVKHPSGSAPTLTVAGVDLIVLMTDDNGTTWRCIVAGRDLR